MVPVVLLLYSLGHVDLGISSSGAMNHRYLWMFLFSNFVSESFEKTEKRIPRSPCNTPDASQDLKYALKGQEINFKPSIPEKPDLIFWVHHDGRGVVLFDDKGELNFPSYEDRIILDHNTAELTVYNVTYEDSGSYILRWNINNEDYHLKYPVEVIDHVTKPNISCKMVDQNQAFLECLTEGKSDPLLKFKWRSQGTEQTDPILKINLSDKQDVYHCDVSNPLTNETASFLAKDCFLMSSSPDSLQDPQYVLKGQEINFLPSLPGKPDLVGWLHDGIDVVWFDPQTGKEDVSPPYKDRITLEQESARLTIKDATYEDSGNYDLKLMINDQHHCLKYRIEVIDKVDQPHILCVLTSPNRALLVCSTDSKHPDLLEFKWSSDGKEHPGPNLQINVRGKHDDRVYRCDVSNPLTKETANFTAGDCFLEPFEKTKKRIRRSPCNTPDESQDLKYVLKGQEINFKPPIPEKPDLIIWFYHDGRGVVLFDVKGELNFPSYKDRIILDHNTAELTINNATYEDSGSYILRWNINNEECHLKYPVEVIDNIPKIEIPYSTDWIHYVILVAVGCLVTILGCIVCRRFSYSERLYFEKQETTKVESPSAAIEMTPFVTLGTNPTGKQNLGSELFETMQEKRFERLETTEVASRSAAKEMIPSVKLTTNDTSGEET